MGEPDVPPVVLVTGSDELLRSDAVRAAVREHLGDRDRAEVVHELSGDGLDPAAVVAAASTPPFLADRRIVVARGAEAMGSDGAQALARYLADPLPTSALVVEWTGRVPKALTDAVKAAGGRRVTADAPGGGRARAAWVAERFDTAAVHLDPAARDRVADHVGEDLGRLGSVLDTLVAVHGEGAHLGPDDVADYLTDAGRIPPWDLTDPIDAGDVGGALLALARMLDAGGMHPLQVMAILHRHVEQALRLDGAGAADEKAAAAVLGMTGSTYPARKALTRARTWQRDGIAEGIRLLASVDVDLRGGTDLDDRAVMEVLVARMARALGGRSPARR